MDTFNFDHAALHLQELFLLRAKMAPLSFICGSNTLRWAERD